MLLCMWGPKGRINRKDGRVCENETTHIKGADQRIRSTVGPVPYAGSRDPLDSGGRKDRRARRVELPAWLPGWESVGGKVGAGRGGVGIERHISLPQALYSKSPYSPHIQAVMPLYSPCRLARLAVQCRFRRPERAVFPGVPSQSDRPSSMAPPLRSSCQLGSANSDQRQTQVIWS